MQMPLRSLPMVMDFAVDGETKKIETTKAPTPVGLPCLGISLCPSLRPSKSSSEQCEPILWMCLTLLPSPHWNCRNLLLVWRSSWRVSFRYDGHCVPCVFFHFWRCVVTNLRSRVQDFELPHFNKTFMDNLEGLKSQYTEEEWKVNSYGDIVDTTLAVSTLWMQSFTFGFALCRALSPGCVTGWSSRWPSTSLHLQHRVQVSASSSLVKLVSLNSISSFSTEA